MRHRITINNPVLVIGSSAEGKLSNNRLLPNKNIYPKQERISYCKENKDRYREFSKSIETKVNAFKNNLKSLQVKNRNLELLVRKNTAKNIANSLNRIILNTKEE